MNYESLNKYLNKNNGYITTSEIMKLGITKPMIPEIVEKGIIRKVAYGIYIDNNLIEDEYYLLQKRFSNIIFSYNTACHLLNLSDRAPYKLDVTTINGKKINEDLNIHYVAKEKINIGVIEITSPYGNPIKIYNAERCICDMLKNQREFEIELYNKIIKNYFKSKTKNLIILEEYAKIFNVYEKLNNIMEVLI